MRRLLIALIVCAPLWAATETNSPTANAAVWTDAGNAHTQNDALATGDIAQTESYTSFGFSIGAGSTVDGIRVLYDAHRNPTDKNNTLEFNLLNVGTCTLKETGVLADSDTDAYRTEGSTSDTWSCTALTGANVDNSAFGVSVTGAKSTGQNPDADSYKLDHVEIIVEYTEASGVRRVIIAD